MSIQRPLTPIGHCSARLRRALAIEEEEALGRTVRVRVPEEDRSSGDRARGSRWSRPADFRVPGAYHGRFVSADNRTTFHCSLEAVSKTADGGCRITTPDGSKRLASGATAEHSGYIERPGAVAAIEPEQFDRYAGRDTAVERTDESRAILSNISDVPDERANYWRAVHEHERTPGADRLTLVPEKASRAAWQRLADRLELPEAVREVAIAFAKPQGKRKTRTVTLDVLGLDRTVARILVGEIREVLETKKGKHAVRLSEGRGGRSQYRLTAELPHELDAAGRLSVLRDLCEQIGENGLMYVAALHAPDHHNDRRNYHIHVAFHDRPARMIGDRWDFEIAVPVPGQYDRVRYPHRQPKVGDWARDPEGGGHRAYGSKALAELRAGFADLCNEQLERIGAERRLHPGDQRSLGCSREPQAPLGPKAAPLEAAGVPTRTGIANAELLWSALIREAWEKAERRSRERADLRRRIAHAEREAGLTPLTGQALAQRLRSLGTRLDAADTMLGAHEAELAEYDVTLAMTRARPDKALDTCRRILTAIEEETASRADVKARPAIETRAGEAEAFLADIAAIDGGNTSVLAEHRTAVLSAQADVNAITAEVTALLERNLPAVRAAAGRTGNDERVVLEAMFDRIMAADLPILLPDGTGAGHRVPGISRDELRAVRSPALADMAQKRLAALADLQAHRMRAAAAVVAKIGLPGVERAAADGEAGAARALKHARAYADHPVYQEALRQAEVSSASPVTRRPGSTSGALWGAIKTKVSGMVGRDDPAAEATSAPPATATVPEAEAPAPEPAVVPAAPVTSRDDAIQELAAEVLTNRVLKVVEREGHLVLDASAAPDWQRSVDAFGEERVVQDAMRQRYAAPWIVVPEHDRERLLGQLEAALRKADSRPILRAGERWRVDRIDAHWVQFVERWQHYGPLGSVLFSADLHWRIKENPGAWLPPSGGSAAGPAIPAISRGVER